jgi:hypothetical protein
VAQYLKETDEVIVRLKQRDARFSEAIKATQQAVNQQQKQQQQLQQQLLHQQQQQQQQEPLSGQPNRLNDWFLFRGGSSPSSAGVPLPMSPSSSSSSSSGSVEAPAQPPPKPSRLVSLSLPVPNSRNPSAASAVGAGSFSSSSLSGENSAATQSSAGNAPSLPYARLTHEPAGNSPAALSPLMFQFEQSDAILCFELNQFFHQIVRAITAVWQQALREDTALHLNLRKHVHNLFDLPGWSVNPLTWIEVDD